jgi:hypothetical protein
MHNLIINSNLGADTMNNKINLHTKIFETRNIYADLFIPTIRRPNFSNNTQELFLSTICYNQKSDSTSTSDTIAKTKQVLEKLERQKISFLIIDGKLEFKPSQTLIQSVKKHLSNLPQNLNTLNLDFNQLVVEINNSEQLQISNINIFVNSFINTLSKYQLSESKINKNAIVNLAVKLIYWYKTYKIANLNLNLNTLDSSHQLPKIFHFGDLSLHEEYFLMFLSSLGFDALAFNFKSPLPQKNVSTSDLNRRQKNVTSTHKTNINSSNGINSSNNNSSHIRNSSANNENNVNSNSTILSAIKKKKLDSGYIVKSKKFDGSLDELLEPLKNRAGYAGLPSPILPIYFVRYIGSDSNKKQYNNKLYHFDEKLKSNSRYIKFTSTLPVSSHPELNKKTSQLWSSFNFLDNTNLSDFVESLAGINFFDFIKDSQLQNQSYISLKNILELIVNKEQKCPISKVKNILLKSTGWLIDHYNTLLSSYSLEKEYPPVILYYGDIKKHEAYYLVFLFNLGVDIVYINSFSDEIFENIDPDNDFSSICVLDKVSALEPFPETESLLQHETVAYQASEEIAQVVYNDQDGVYKPWQFESYKTMPLTLKTTYDEVLLLWNEEARIRAGFKVEKETVYIPNLFTKISGTPDDLNSYWDLISLLNRAPQVKLYSKLPFSNISFDTAKLSSIDLAFEGHSSLSFDKLKSHSMYPFEHFSDALQKQIFDKINLLIHENILLNKDSKYLSLKIVYTIFNMDQELLHLIQTFDYPANVPKLLIYDPDEITFSESDAIIMSFLYLFGFDICVFTPTGYNNFEKFIDQNYYNVFKLPRKQFNLELPNLNRFSSSKSNKGFWNNLFKFK